MILYPRKYLKTILLFHFNNVQLNFYYILYSKINIIYSHTGTTVCVLYHTDNYTKYKNIIFFYSDVTNYDDNLVYVHCAVQYIIMTNGVILQTIQYPNK